VTSHEPICTRELRFLTLSYACAWQVDDVRSKVRITGTQDQVELAVRMCEEIMDSHRTTELDVRGHVGLLIGPGGQTVSRLEDQSGARIEVSDLS
jgi:rRNA processing protein Krr1/Pno1